MKKVLILLSIMLFSNSSFAFDHTHGQLDKLLKTHVKYIKAQSLLNYKAIKSKPAMLNNYLTSLSTVTKTEYKSFTERQKLAFLINAYNAFTIKLILDNYPLKSIKDLGSWYSSPWSKKFFTLLGKKMNLDEVEHDIIRKNFKESRIHFAVNCASISCPSLMPFAFRADKLNQQLNIAANGFLKNTSKNRFNAKTKKLELSKVFKWYSEDFDKTHGSVEAFIAPFLSDDKNQQGIISSKTAVVNYLDYDWSLNEWK